MYELFIKSVKEKLREKNISVRSLCKNAGLDASLFAKVLKGKRNPPFDEKVITKIARQLDVEPVKLIFYTGHIPEKWMGIFCSDDFINRLAGGSNGTGRVGSGRAYVSPSKNNPVKRIRDRTKPVSLPDRKRVPAPAMAEELL